MANRKKLIHIHSNVYTSSGPQAPAYGVLEKGEIAVNYNDTEPALFIENNSGMVIKFNAVQRSEIDAINSDISGALSDIQSIKGNNTITLNGTSKTLTGSTWSFYAPTSSGEVNTVLVSDGKNKSPKWVDQSGLTVGSAASADKVKYSLTINGNGSEIASYDGSSATTVNITPQAIGAAGSTHSHSASDLPTATTSVWGVTKLGSGSNNAAPGNHTHSDYVNPTVTNKDVTLAWGTKTTAATIGNTAITITPMSLPTPGDIGAAASTHSHGASDLPTATTSAWGVTKLGTGSNNAAAGNHTHEAYVNPTVTNKSATWAWGSTVTAATIGSTAITIAAPALPSPSDIGAAESQHSHGIADIPSQTTLSSTNDKVPTGKAVKDYVDGLVASPVNYKGAVTNGTLPASATSKVGDLYIVQTAAISIASGSSATGAAQTAEVGDYIICRTAGKWDVIQKNLNGAVTSSENLSSGNFVLGNGNQTVKNSSYGPSSFAAATHSHDASALPTATTSAYGITKLGTAAGTAAEGNHTHSAYVNPTVTDKGATWAWGSTVTAATIGNTALTISAPALPTPSDIGAAAASHSHGASDLPTASTTAYGLIKVGSGALDAAAGNHTHSAYVNPAVTNKGATWDWGNTVTAATIGNTAITIAAPSLPTPGDIGAAAASHSHDASALPTAATNAYGIMKVGDFLTVNNGVVKVTTGTSASSVAVGNHTHKYAASDSAGGAANSTKGTLTLSGNGTTIATFNGSESTGVNITYTTVGAAAASHGHAASDLPTGSTSAYGILKLGTAAGTAAQGNHTHSEYVNPTVTNCAQTLSWNTTVTAATIGSNAITIKAMAKPTPGDIGAAPASHSHEAADLPTATDSALGLVKVGNFLSVSSGTISVKTGTTGSNVAVGNHTHKYAASDSVGGAANSTKGTLTLSGNGTTIATFNGSESTGVNITYTTVGAAAASHSHGASDLPTASTTAYGLIKVGSGALDAAAGNHTHSAYVNPTVTNCAQTLSWGTTVTAATIGSTAITVKAMAKPTPGDIGAAAASHSHDAAALPTAATNAYGIMKVGDFLTVNNGVVKVTTGTSASSVAVGNHTHNYAGSSSAGGAANSTKGTLTLSGNGTTIATFNGSESTGVNITYTTVGAAAASHSHGASDLPTASTTAYGLIKVGSGALDAAAGNHTHSAYVNPTVTNKSATWAWGSTVTAATIGSTSITIAAPALPTPSDIGAAAATHSHTAAQLPTASTSAFGIVKVGTASGTVAAGDHTHSNYVNPTVTNCAQTLSWGTTTTAATIGNDVITIKAMAKPTPGDIGAAPASHSHDAAALPTGSTTAYGILKLGTAAENAAAGNHTHSAYVNPTVTNCAQTLSWNTTVTAATIGSTAITVKAMAKPTYSDVGAAAASHSHDAAALPTASTTAYGITKLGTAAGTAAEGNHTHSAYVNPTVTNCAQTLSWGTTVTAATIGNDVITIKAMAKPTYSDVGAAAASHSHTTAQLPVDSTISTATDKLPTSKAVKDYVDGLVVSPVNYKGAVTSGSLPASATSKVGDMYIVQTSAITIASGSSATGAAQTAEVGDYIICRSSGKWDVIQKNLNGAVTSSVALTANNFVVGNGNQTVKTSSYGPSSFAAATHSHDAADLPTASTTAYGLIKVGSGALDAAAGNHTHSAYVNPTVTNKSATWAWGSTVTAATIGSTSITIAAPSLPTPGDIGAAAASHSHTAAQLPTASTTAYGVIKIGSGASDAAAGNHSHSAYVNPTVTNCAQTLSWGTTTTAATIGNDVITIKAMAKPTPADIGAAAATHSHTAAQLPTGSTTAYGILKLGTAAENAAAGNHTHSAYVNPTVTNCAQTLSWGTTVTAATIGSTSITIAAMAKPTPSDIGAAAATHSHNAAQLPTASTTAYGITKLGTAAGTAAEGNHTHSAYVNPTVTNCAQTLSWNTTITAATIGSTAITVKAMAKPTYTYGDVGAAAASHSHNASDINGTVANADKVDGYHVSVVTSIPSSPDANTIYILK